MLFLFNCPSTKPLTLLMLEQRNIDPLCTRPTTALRIVRNYLGDHYNTMYKLLHYCSRYLGRFKSSGTKHSSGPLQEAMHLPQVKHYLRLII